MRRWLRLLAVALPLLLAACVPPAVRMKGDAGLFEAQLARERALAQADHWVLQGRLGVSNGKDGGSGSFSWTQDGEQYEFVLRGPAISGMNFRLSGGPRNDFQVTVHLPKNCDLFLRVPAGDVTVEGIVGDKDIELHAGDLSIHVGNPNEYSQVDASVSAGDVSASPFGESHSGLFRSFRKSGSGRYKLHAHVGAGDLTLL